ncbi:MAG: TolC family protein, partial [Chryseobacterium sp.]|nr:TolC family protein [Chryseobacterium sp.]
MKTIILALLGFTGFNAMGQVQFGSLQEVLAYADKNAISIQSALHQEQIATVKNKASKTALMPTVNASAGFNDNMTIQPTLVPANLFNPAAPEGTFNEYTFGRRYIYNAGVQANWDVINFQKWFDITISQAALQLNQANTINTKYQVYNQLAQTYFSILLTEKYLKISKENIVTADNIYRIARDKYDTGIFTEENLNRSKIQLVQAKQQVSSSESSLEQLYNQLQSQLNIDEPLVLKDELLDKEMNTGDALVMTTSHPEVLVQEAQVQLSEKQLAQTRSLQYPTLTLGYQYNYNWATDKMLDFSGASNLPQQFWGMKLSIPLFNGFNIKSKIKQSKIQLEQEQMVLQSKKLIAKKDDDNVKIQYSQSVEDFRKQE